jgi:predicted transposase/invertase (TIGR01784 family)
MGKFINPFTDVGFKRIFGQEITKDLLIDFLNDLLKGERNILDITFLDKEQIPVFDKDRGLIYDIYCTTDTGEKIIVEMQNKYQKNFKDRSLYYLSQAISRQGERGADWDYSINAVYGVFFMNFILEDKPSRYRRDVELIDRVTHELFNDKMRFIYLELPSFDKEEHDCETDFERWIYVLKHMDTLQRLPFKAQKLVFDKLEKIVDIASMTKEEREKYDESIRIFRDNKAIALGQHERGFAEGVAAGEQKGYDKGKSEGKMEGKIEGKIEGITEGEKKGKRDVAINMRKLGVSNEIISKATGLPLDEIEQITNT